MNIQNRQFNCLIDTGANISAISESLLHKLTYTTSTEHNNALPTVFTASGQLMQFKSVVEMNIDVKGLILPCRFYVTDSLAPGTNIILGMDLLRSFQCTIDLCKGLISFYDGLVTVALQQRCKDNTLGAKICKNFTLEPNTEAILALSVPHGLPNTDFILEPTNRTLNGPYIMARALVSPNTGKVNCRIANVTNKPVLLKRNCVIANLR